MSSPLPSFTTPQTLGLGQEDHYLQVVTEKISTMIASKPDLQGPEATQAPTSGTRTSTAPPPPPSRGSTSPAWSGLCDNSNEDDASAFSVETSKAISTSPPDPSVDTKRVPSAKHTASRTSWLHTCKESQEVPVNFP
jgi:hypothetical protein